MSDDTTAPTRGTERWVFGGSRVVRGKRLHAWVDADHTLMMFGSRGSYAVGSAYEVDVTRSGDGGVTMHGTPRYDGRGGDTELIDQLSAEHRAAELLLASLARERADKQDDPVEQAIQRLAHLTAHIPPSQRAMFAGWVSARLTNVWQHNDGKTKPRKG